VTNELHFATIAEASDLIRTRKLSPVEYTNTLLRRIEALEPQLNAFITVTADLARSQARHAEAEIMSARYRGPMHGIPVALKDIYNTKGILTSGGSRISARLTVPESCSIFRKRPVSV
jgi:Asp-tRNA(Asn)/Glu-tRNA(Gln) amidotransferase A subunit family amidase